MSLKPLEITENCSRLQIFSRKSLEISNFCLKNCSKLPIFERKPLRSKTPIFLRKLLQILFQNCSKMPIIPRKLLQITKFCSKIVRNFYPAVVKKHPFLPENCGFLFLGLEHTQHVICIGGQMIVWPPIFRLGAMAWGKEISESHSSRR